MLLFCCSLDILDYDGLMKILGILCYMSFIVEIM